MHFLCKKAVMDLLLLAGEHRKNEFLSIVPSPGCKIQWLDNLPVDDKTLRADLVIDLLFDNSPGRVERLQQPAFDCVMVNWLQGGLPGNLVAINGWPGFMGRTLIEASCGNEGVRQHAEVLAAQAGRTIEWITEASGFISPAIVGGIINEAFLALEEGTGTEEAIDTAMKLGTNYPFGPFQWARQIGYRNVVDYLEYNNRHTPGYQVSILLKEKALAQ
ncbi:MAG: hypothetical protein EOO05_13675 [Chitinophagaceae bacterium]|nr:MAG: hypothetical protein EOO05_13675 [Chitinophagaceae bacterium]